MFCRAANTNAQHPRRAPARAHGGKLFDHPVDDIIAGVHHLELGLVLAAATLGSNVNTDRIARHHLNRQHAWGVVASVATSEGRISQYRGTQLVFRIVIRLTHTFIDHFLQAAIRIKAAVHAPLHEHVHDAGILTDRAMPLCAHAAVGQDLRNCILRRRALLCLIGFAQGPDIVHRMIVRDILKGVRYALDQILFRYDCHVAHRRAFPCCRFALPDSRVCRHRSKRLATMLLAPKATEACKAVLLM